MKEVFIGIGIELGLVMGLPALDITGGWRLVFGCALAPALLMLVGMVSLPDIPNRKCISVLHPSSS
jgi:predicted MFS family arabinose efflux permease